MNTNPRAIRLGLMAVLLVVLSLGLTSPYAHATNNVHTLYYGNTTVDSCSGGCKNLATTTGGSTSDTKQSLLIGSTPIKDPNANSVQTAVWTSGTSVTITGLSTTDSPDTIIVFVGGSDVAVTSISSSGGITFDGSARGIASGGIGCPAGRATEWRGKAGSALTSASITINFASTPSAISAGVTAWFGAEDPTSTWNPFDKASLPATAVNNNGIQCQNNTPSVTPPTTLNAHDMQLCMVANGDSASVTETVGTGFTMDFNVAGSSRSIASEHESFSSTTANNCNFGTAEFGWKIITDFLQSAPVYVQVQPDVTSSTTGTPSQSSTDGWAWVYDTSGVAGNLVDIQTGTWQIDWTSSASSTATTDRLFMTIWNCPTNGDASCTLIGTDWDTGTNIGANAGATTYTITSPSISQSSPTYLTVEFWVVQQYSSTASTVTLTTRTVSGTQDLITPGWDFSISQTALWTTSSAETSTVLHHFNLQSQNIGSSYGAEPTVVQSRTGSKTTAGSTFTLAYSSNLGTKHLLFACGTVSQIGVAPTVTDSLGNSFTALSVVQNLAAVGCGYAFETTGGADTVTFTLSSGSCASLNGCGMVIFEISGATSIDAAHVVTATGGCNSSNVLNCATMQGTGSTSFSSSPWLVGVLASQDQTTNGGATGYTETTFQSSFGAYEVATTANPTSVGSPTTFTFSLNDHSRAAVIGFIVKIAADYLMPDVNTAQTVTSQVLSSSSATPDSNGQRQDNGVNTASISLTMGAPSAANEYVFVGENVGVSGGRTCSTPTATGITFTQIAHTSDSINCVYWGFDTGSGALTVTCAASNANSYLQCVGWFWQGPPGMTGSPLDSNVAATCNNKATSALTVSCTYSTTTADDVIFAFGSDDNGNAMHLSAGTGFTTMGTWTQSNDVNQACAQGVCAEYQHVTTTQSSATAAMTSSNTGTFWITAFAVTTPVSFKVEPDWSNAVDTGTPSAVTPSEFGWFLNKDLSNNNVAGTPQVADIQAGTWTFYLTVTSSVATTGSATPYIAVWNCANTVLQSCTRLFTLTSTTSLTATTLTRGYTFTGSESQINNPNYIYVAFWVQTTTGVSATLTWTTADASSGLNTPAWDYQRTKTASLSISSTLTELISYFRSLLANLHIDSAVARLLQLFRTFTVSFTVSSTKTANANFFRMLTAMLSLMSTSTQQYGYKRNPTASFSVSSSLSRLVRYFRTETASLTISAVRTSQFAFSLPASLTVGSALTEQYGYKRALTATLSIAAVLTRQLAIMRTTTASWTMSSSVSRMVGALRTLTASFSIQSAFSIAGNHFVTLTAHWTMASTSRNQESYLRTLSETWDMVAAITKAELSAHVTLSESFTIDSTLTFMPGRLISESFGIDSTLTKQASAFRSLSESFTIDSQVINTILINLMESWDMSSHVHVPNQIVHITESWGIHAVFSGFFGCNIAYGNCNPRNGGPAIALAIIGIGIGGAALYFATRKKRKRGSAFGL